MDPWITAGVVAAILLVVVFVLFAKRKANRPNMLDPVFRDHVQGSPKPTMEIRKAWLSGKFLDLPIEPVAGIVGMLVDMSMGPAVASLVAMADGSTSLYFDNGGGVIGAGQHDPVREATGKLLARTAQRLELFGPTPNHDLPTPGNFRFFVMTPTGLLFAEASEANLMDDAYPLAELFSLANDVLTQVRLASEKMGA